MWRSQLRTVWHLLELAIASWGDEKGRSGCRTCCHEDLETQGLAATRDQTATPTVDQTDVVWPKKQPTKRQKVMPLCFASALNLGNLLPVMVPWETELAVALDSVH